MPKHVIEIRNVTKGRIEHNVPPYVSIDMPEDSTVDTMEGVAYGAKEAVGQMLARLGVHQEVGTVFVASLPTEQEAKQEAIEELSVSFGRALDEAQSRSEQV